MIGIEIEALNENTDHDLDKPATPKLEGGIKEGHVAVI